MVSDKQTPMIDAHIPVSNGLRLSTVRDFDGIALSPYQSFANTLKNEELHKAAALIAW